jgi:hypothetical protein
MISAVVGLLVVLNTVAVEAQFGGRQQQQRGGPAAKPQTQPYTGKGTIDAIARGMIKMTSGTDSVVIEFSNNSKVRVTGTAQPDFLKRGQLVAFNATLDKKAPLDKKSNARKIEGEIKKLTIFTQGADFTEGCLPDTGGGDAPAAGAGLSAGIGLPAGKGKGKGKIKGEGAAAAEAGPKPYIVAGSIIKSIKGDGGYTLAVRVKGVKGNVELEIKDGMQIDVDLGDASLAKQGDTIDVTQGQQMKMGATTMVMANEAKIILSAPLTGATKKGAHGKAGHAKKTEEGAATEPAGAAKPEGKAKPADSK